MLGASESCTDSYSLLVTSASLHIATSTKKLPSSATFFVIKEDVSQLLLSVHLKKPTQCEEFRLKLTHLNPVFA